MPATPGGIAGIVQTNLASVGMLGMDVPKISLGLGIGVSSWVAQIVVQTVDVGTAGGGSGGPIPVTVPPAALLANIQTGFASSGLVGQFAPLLSTGIANGLAQAFLQALVKTTHAGVGTGSGVAKFIAPPATPVVAAGLSSAGVIGQFAIQLATAVGVGLDVTFASLVIPVPIVGSGSPTAATGTGVGQII